MNIILFIVFIFFFAKCKKEESETIEDLFKVFISDNKKGYIPGSNEYNHRFEIFQANYHLAKQLNDTYPDTIYGITIFSDLTKEEFSRYYLSKPNSKEENPCDTNGARLIKDFRLSNDVPKNFDWKEKGAVTKVKNQGMCGSCWAFSAIGNIEGQWFLNSGELVDLSPQQLVDCDPKSDGCKGGWMDWGFEYLINTPALLEKESDYKYEEVTMNCSYKPEKGHVNITSYYKLPENEEVMKEYLYNHGPLAVALSADLLQFYIGGLFDPVDLLCPHDGIDHGVLIVGYGEHAGLERKPYWKVKNSWGHFWGEMGYFKIRRGKGKCGIAKCVSTAIIE